MKRIVLFTPFAPTTGGGQILRSALPHLKDVEITWAYLSPRPVEFPNSVHLGQPLINGPLLGSLVTMATLCLGHHQKLESVVEKLLSLEADKYWIVAHHEGATVAEMLMKNNQLIHISFHDDPPRGVLGRSQRFCLLAGLGEGQLKRLLKRAASVDAASPMLAARYQSLYGRNPFVCSPYIDTLPKLAQPCDDGVIRIGFSGSLFSPREARVFGRALKIAQDRARKTIEWHFWGLNAIQRAWVESFPYAVFHPSVPEEELVRELSAMNVLYLACPFDKTSAVYRQTSLPIKLVTYLKAQRPIFAHTPVPSAPAEFVSKTGTGLISSSTSASELVQLLIVLLTTPLSPTVFQLARDGWYGPENLKRLNEALLT